MYYDSQDQDYSDSDTPSHKHESDDEDHDPGGLFKDSEDSAQVPVKHNSLGHKYVHSFLARDFAFKGHCFVGLIRSSIEVRGHCAGSSKREMSARRKSRLCSIAALPISERFSRIDLLLQTTSQMTTNTSRMIWRVDIWKLLVFWCLDYSQLWRSLNFIRVINPPVNVGDPESHSNMFQWRQCARRAELLRYWSS